MAFDHYNDASESSLLIAFANGDHEAGRVLIIRLTPNALGQAFRMLQDRGEAEDVVQEAMLKLWKQAPDWQHGQAQVSTWMYRVIANLCMDRFRRRKRGIDLEDIVDPVDDRPSIAARMQEQSRMQALSEALRSLPDRQAQAVALRHLEGLSNPEVAKVMETSIEAVESLTARGKRTLAKILVRRKAELGYDE